METFTEQAATYNKCIEKIMAIYGPNIIVTRIENKKTGGFLGLFEKDSVKVTFNISNKIPFTPKINNPDFEETKKAEDSIKVKTKTVVHDDATERLNILKMAAEKSQINAEQLKPYIKQIENNNEPPPGEIGEELKTLAKTVEMIAEQIREKNNLPDEHKNIKTIKKILEENNFTNNYIQLIQTKIKTLTLNEIDDLTILQQKVIDFIAETIIIKKTEENSDNKIISLVGPTGIGKTTTLIKMAAYYQLIIPQKTRKICDVKIITIDDFRIGSAFQIQRYCDIMGIPLSMVQNKQDFLKYVALFKNDADVIFIDTTGRSPNDTENIKGMKKYFDKIENENLEIHIALSAVTKFSDMREIIKQYKIFGGLSIIITKLDETSSVGEIISAVSEFQMPISYITTGQNVPKDIAPASKHAILKRLKGFTLKDSYITEHFNDEEYINWISKQELTEMLSLSS